LFIDGDHFRAGEDYKKFEPYLVDCAKVVFHDYKNRVFSVEKDMKSLRSNLIKVKYDTEGLHSIGVFIYDKTNS